MGVGTVHHVAFRVAERGGAARGARGGGGARLTTSRPSSTATTSARSTSASLAASSSRSPRTRLASPRTKTPDHLGESLKLPPWLEKHREGIEEASLPPPARAREEGARERARPRVRPPLRPRRDDPAPRCSCCTGPAAPRTTCSPLGRELAPGAAILSPRGKVLEYGAPASSAASPRASSTTKTSSSAPTSSPTSSRQAAEEYGFDRRRSSRPATPTGPTSPGASCSCTRASCGPRSCSGRWCPSSPKSTPDLSGMPVFIAAGRRDQMIPPGQLPASRRHPDAKPAPTLTCAGATPATASPTRRSLRLRRGSPGFQCNGPVVHPWSSSSAIMSCGVSLPSSVSSKSPSKLTRRAPFRPAATY